MMTEARPIPGKQTSAVASALAGLRERIARRVLLPGEQIRQDEMALSLGVSRVPLREALRVLASEGMLEHRPNQGYFVARMGAETLQQIVSLLEFLETELIRTLRWPSPAEIAQLRSLNQRMREALHSRGISEVSELNREFHFVIFRLSHLDLYVTECERLWALAAPYLLMHVAATEVQRIAEQHESLIDALAAQDRALCLRVSSEHRRETTVTALDVIGSRGDFGSRASSPAERSLAQTVRARRFGPRAELKRRPVPGTA
jgi:DNA-binding GntR family transcriptional regulator